MLSIAELWKDYSTCLRRHVGAVVFHPKTWAVVSVGYNDTPIGWPDCGDGGCEPCKGSESVSTRLDCNCVHAEANAIYLAARRGQSVEGCWIATTYKTCGSCMKMYRQAGIVYVIESSGREYTVPHDTDKVMLSVSGEYADRRKEI